MSSKQHIVEVGQIILCIVAAVVLVLGAKQIQSQSPVEPTGSLTGDVGGAVEWNGRHYEQLHAPYKGGKNGE